MDLKKKSLMKNILTTASVVALVAGGASSALGAAARVTGGNEAISNAGTWAVAAPADGDSIQLDANARNIDFDRANAIIAGIDLAGKHAGGWTITKSVSIGSIGNGGNAGNVTMVAGQTLTLTGTATVGGAVAADVYTGLANIDFNNTNAIVTVRTASGNAITLVGKFQNAGTATLNVETDLVATNANAATTALAVKTINIGTVGNARTLTVQPTAAAVTIAGDVRFANADSVLALDSTNGGALTTFTINGGSVGNSGDGVGIVSLIANGQHLTVAKNAAETLGTSNAIRLKELRVTGANNVIVNTATYAKKITAGGTGNLTFGAIVDSGAGSELNITAVTPLITFSENTTIGTINFGNQATNIKVADNKKLTANLIGDSASAANTNGTLTFVGSGELAGTATQLAKIVVGAGANPVVKLSGAHTVTEIFNNNGGAATLELADGFSLTGAINTTAGGAAAKLQFKGDGTVTGAIGAGLAVGDIEIHGDNTKTVDLQAAVTAASIKFITANGKAKVKGDITGNINFAADGSLELYNNTAQTITGAVILAADNTGTIIANNVPANKALTITGQIGDVAAGKALKLLQVTGGGDIVLTGNTASIKKIDIGPQDVTLTLNNGGDYKIVEFAHNDGSGTVKIDAADITIKNGSVLSTDKSALNKVHFQADRVLTLEDGVNLYTANGITANANNTGSIEFKGSSTVTGKIGAGANTLKNLTISGAADKTVTLGEVNIAGDAIFDNAASGTLVITGNAKANKVDTKNAGKGIIRLENANPITVTLAAVSGNAIEKVDINGTDISIENFGINTNSVNFINAKQDATLTIKTANAQLGLATITTASTTANHHLVLKADTNFTQAVGADGKTLGNITLDGGIKATVGAADFYASAIKSTKADTDTVEIAGSKLKVKDLGTDNRLLAINVTQDVEVLKDGVLNAKTIKVSVGKTFTINSKEVKGEELQLDGAASKAYFKGAIALNTKVVANNANQGILAFDKDVTITKDIGSTASNLASASFGEGAVKFAGGNVYVNGNVDFTKSTVTLGQNTTFGATAVNFDANSTMDLGTNKLTVTQVGAAGNAINVNGKMGFTYAGDTGSGQISFTTAGSKLNLGNANLTLLITDQSDIPDNTRTFSLATDTAGNAVTLNQANLPTITIVAGAGNIGSSFVKWTWEQDAKNALTGKLLQTNTAKAGLTALNTSVGGFADTDISFLTDTKNSGGAKDLLTQIAKLESTPEKAKNAYERVKDGAQLTANAVNTTISQTVQAAANTQIAARLSSVMPMSTVPVQLTQNESVGVAAGDEAAATKYGAWGMPFFSKATQKARKGASGYKGTTSGGIIGFDAQLNDNLVAGGAVTIARSNIKHRDIKAGDTTKADTAMFSLYGVQRVADSWFVQGLVSFGSVQVKNKANRIVAGAPNQLVYGKYDATIYSGEVLAGYDYRFVNNSTITPIIGFAASHYNNSGYKETGNNLQKLGVSQKSNDKFEVIAGAKFATSMDTSGITLLPEIHANVRQDLTGKAPKIDAQLDGAGNPLPAKAVKPARTFYNVGLSLGTKASNMEYGIGYDAYLANKYVGHQGTLKIRVNF